MKAEIKGLQGTAQHEKRSLSDKVAAELDATLKQAVREKVETKKLVDKTNNEIDVLQRQYDDLSEMYSALQQTGRQNE